MQKVDMIAFVRVRLCVDILINIINQVSHDGDLMPPPHLPPVESMIWLDFGGPCSKYLHINEEN